MDQPDQPHVVATMAVHGVDDLASARRLLVETATAVGMPADRIDRLAVAVSEVVSNAILHGNGSATMTITSSDTGLTVNVRDRGTGLTTRPAPTPPDATQIDGRGLWLAERLCDQVRIDSSTRGTIVRLTMQL